MILPTMGLNFDYFLDHLSKPGIKRPIPLYASRVRANDFGRQ
jgi:hypothetical protein